MGKVLERERLAAIANGGVKPIAHPNLRFSRTGLCSEDWDF